MPCNSDHMEPRADEVASRKAAQHLVYVQTELGLPVAEGLRHASEYIYGDVNNLGLFTKQLCRLLSGMTEEEIDRIVYNARSKESRSLADWWENHQEHDRKREELEAEVREAEKLLDSARSKLSAAERKVLGL